MTDTRPEITQMITRGLRRHLASGQIFALTEFVPERGKRVDLIALTRSGEIWVIEVKSSLADFQADAKWPGYRNWCDRFYFGVAREFPVEVLPDDAGLFIADGFDGQCVREAPLEKLAPARRKALTLRIARQAMARLQYLEDPGPQFGLAQE
ncbi:MAG: MmcB family DNA repair protein [Neomegalonema sp.]|nr:MmcB family DNA repair protein [Neomegalonema sp.]